MLFRDIFRILGLFFLGFSCTLLIPLFLAAYYQFIADPSLHPQPHSTLAFLESFVISISVALIFLTFSHNYTGNIFRREGLAIVVFMWVLTPALAALPFVLSGTLTSPFQAYFEAVSGLTTTGSTTMQAKHYLPGTTQEIPIKKTVPGVIDTTYIYYGTITPVFENDTAEIKIEGIEAVSKAILFWRSFTNWLGGGGIVVLFIAVLPALGAGGKVLFQTEIPGPNKEAMTPRLKETAVHLWKIYVGLSLLQVGALLYTNSNMEWLDAITVTFSTISTGGFSIRNGGISFYESVATDWTVIVFMILGSISFTLYFYALKGKIYRFFEPEFFLHMALILALSIIISWSLVGTPKILLTGDGADGVFSVADAIRYGTFQAVSANTTTGFSTADYNFWPYLPQTIMLIVLFIGGMSGSTSSGMKTVRLIMLFRIAQYKVESLFRPEAVRKFKVGNRDVDVGAAAMAMTFFLLITAVSVAGTLLYVFSGVDPETAIGLVACMVNGAGMSFRAAGPAWSCAFLNDANLLLSCLLMILGRLEFFAIFALLVPGFWKQTS